MPGVRRPQRFRRAPVSPLLASVREKLNEHFSKKRRVLISDSPLRPLTRPGVFFNKKKGGIASLFSLRLASLLMHGYFDLSRLGLFGLGHAYLEQTVFVGRLDAVMFHGLGQ